MLKREVERGSTLTLTSDLSSIASILFANVDFTYVRTHVKITRQWKSTLRAAPRFSFGYFLMQRLLLGMNYVAINKDFDPEKLYRAT